MLVSGGKIIAIDSVNTNDTIYGDGVKDPLAVNTDIIVTVAQLNSVSSQFNNYYTKNETSAANQLEQAFDDIENRIGKRLQLSVNNNTMIFTEA